MNFRQWYDMSPDEIALELATMDYSMTANELALLYRRAETLILEAIRRAVTSRPSQRAIQLHALLSQVTKRYQQVLKAADAWAKRRLVEAFRVGAHDAQFGLTRQGRASLTTTFSQVPIRAVNAIVKDTMQDLLARTALTEQRVKDAVRRIVHEDAQVAVASGLRGPDIAKGLADRMRDEQIFGITARNGRFIPADEYARVVARTKLAHAHTAGTEQMLLSNDVDLVRITVHTHRPDVCSPLEGKVYSLTGHSNHYPQLPKHTPFHPNCRHRETPFIETFRSDEELRRIREESNTEGRITVEDPEKLAALVEKQDKRARLMVEKRRLRKQDKADILEGRRDAPKDQASYERSLTARANALVRKRDRLASIANPDSSGAYRRLPQTGEVGTSYAILGESTSIKISRHWKDTSEFANVERALSLFRPDKIEGASVRYTNEFLFAPGEERRVARATYDRKTGEILLSRRSDRDFSSSGPREARKSQKTVWHEGAHHVYNRHVATDATVLSRWMSLQGEGYTFDREVAQEQFAEQFVIAMSRKARTPLRKFFEEFTR